MDGCGASARSRSSTPPPTTGSARARGASGPTAVALHLGKTWVYGALINNVWSVSEDEGRSSVNQMLLQPFVNYNFPDSPGRYLTFAPIITADWEADSGQRGSCRSGWASARSCGSASSR